MGNEVSIKSRHVQKVILGRCNPVHFIVRINALKYIYSLFPEIGLRLLLKALNDADAFVRENAADLLADSGKAEALAPLRALLDDPDTHVRESAQFAIEQVVEVDASSED